MSTPRREPTASVGCSSATVSSSTVGGRRCRRLAHPSQRRRAGLPHPRRRVADRASPGRRPLGRPVLGRLCACPGNHVDAPPDRCHERPLRPRRGQAHRHRHRHGPDHRAARRVRRCQADPRMALVEAGHSYPRQQRPIDRDRRGGPPNGVPHLLQRRPGGDGRWSLDLARALANGTIEALAAELEAERAEHARQRPGNPLPPPPV